MNSRPDKYPPASPYLTVNDAHGAITFYQAAFDAQELYRLVDPVSGTIVHAELMINGCHIMLSEESPQWGNKSPLTLEGSPVTICLMVSDTDAALARAQNAGATVIMPPADMFYGFRSTSIRDPFGHLWMLQNEIEHVTPAEMQKRWNDITKCAQPG